MPIYEYAPTSGQCEKCNGLFEVVQRMADSKLLACPTCGQPCERRISAVALGGTYSVSDDKIKNSGLTKYQKAGDGVYERTAGSGAPRSSYENDRAALQTRRRYAGGLLTT